jgi:hypothetical protein
MRNVLRTLAALCDEGGSSWRPPGFVCNGKGFALAMASDQARTMAPADAIAGKPAPTMVMRALRMPNAMHC